VSGATVGRGRGVGMASAARDAAVGLRVGSTSSRGRYLTIPEAAAVYPVFTTRLLRRLVQERRIAFSRAGRTIVFAETDIETYLERNRVEPPRWNLAV
jgi:excisionase family DNA binding protein